MTVLIGYVPTPAGEAALDQGIAEAERRSTDVVIVNSPRRGATVDSRFIDDATREALTSRAADRGVTATVDHAPHGADLVDTFAALIEQTGADLVVIGLRRRTPVGKLVMGSDAQRLLLELRVPVLAVKAPW